MSDTSGDFQRKRNKASLIVLLSVEAQQLLTTKTFKGDLRRPESSFFGGTVRRTRLRAADRSLLEVDAMLPTQTECAARNV